MLGNRQYQRSRIDFDRVVVILNELLSRKRPTKLSSSWISREAPECYRFIQKNVRAEIGGIDWDRVTHLLDATYQRRWMPMRRRKTSPPYANADEVDIILNRYRGKLYVFIASADFDDRRLRDTISIALVRVAQSGNLLAKQELMKLVGYTIDNWLENHLFLSRWHGYDRELRRKLEGCIRRYRYTGSFIRYVYRTLEYAARGLRPFHAFSLDEPLPDGKRRKIDLIGQDPIRHTTVEFIGRYARRGLCRPVS